MNQIQRYFMQGDNRGKLIPCPVCKIDTKFHKINQYEHIADCTECNTVFKAIADTSRFIKHNRR